MRRNFPLLVALFVLSGLGVTIGLWQSGWVDDWTRRALQAELTRALRHPVRFSRISGDPWRGLVFHDVRVERGPTPRDGPLVAASRVRVAFDVDTLLRDLWAGTRTTVPAIRRVEVDGLALDLVRSAAGRWNVETLFQAWPPGAPAGPVLRAVIVVRGGRVAFADFDRELASPFRVGFSRLEARVDTRDDPLHRLSAAAVANGAASGVRAIGWVDVRDGAIDLDIAARDAVIPGLAPYFLRDAALRWEAGRVDARLHVYAPSYHQAPDVTGTLEVRDASVQLAPHTDRLTSLQGRVEMRPGTLNLRDVTFRYGGSPARVDGEVVVSTAPRVDLAVAGRDLDMAALRRLFAPDAPAVRGRVSGTLRVRGTPQFLRVEGDVAAPFATLGETTVHDVRSGIRYAARTLALDDLQLSIAGGSIDGDVVLGLDDPLRYLAGARLADVPTSIGDRFGLSLPARAQITGVIAASGTAGQTRVAGFVRAPFADVSGWRVMEPRLSFWYDDGNLWIDHASARYGDSSLAAWGSVARDGRLRIGGLARDVDVVTVADRFGSSLPIAGRASSVFKLEGTLAEPTLAGTLTATDGRVGTVAFDDVLAEFLLTRRALHLVRLSVRDGEDLYRIEGDASWGPFGGLSLTLSTEGADAQRLARIAGLSTPVAGVLSGAVRLGGTIPVPKAEGTFSWRDGSILGQSFDRVDAELAWRDGVIDLRRAAVRRNESSAVARGQVYADGRLSLDFEASRLRLEDLGLLRNPAFALRGDLELRGRVEGTVAVPDLTASIRTDNLVVNAQRFDRAEGVVRWRAGTLFLDPVALTLGPSLYTARGTLRFDGDPVADLEAELRAGNVRALLRLGRISADASGTIDGTLRLAGPLSNPRAELDVTVRDATWNRVPIRVARGRLSLSNRRVDIQQLEATPTEGRLAAIGFFNFDGRSEVEVSGENLPVDLLRMPLRFRQPLLGRFGFTLQLVGTLQDPRAGLTFEMTGAGPEGAVADRIIGEAFYRDGELTIEQVLIERSGQRLRIAGEIPADPVSVRVDPDRQLSLRVVADQTDLSVLRLFVPAVEQAQGGIGGQVEVSGTIANPRLEGGFTVTDGRIKLFGVNTPLDGLRGQLQFVENRARLTQFEGGLGSGRVMAGAELVFRDLEPNVVDATLRFSNATLDVPNLYRGQIDGTLALTGPAANPVAGGRLVFSAGELITVLAPSRPTAGTGPSIAFNMEVAAGPALFANVGSLRVALQGGLHVGGALGRPMLNGTIVGTGGQYRAFGIPFELEQATGTFQEFRGLEPLITARARTRVNDVTIFANIRGTPRELSLVLTSDPALSQERIAQLLAGQTGFAGQPNTNAITALVAQELSRLLLGDFETRLRELLGLTEFEIDYDFQRPLQLRLGRFVVDQLHFTVTTTLGEQTAAAWALEYRFAPNYALVLGSDRRNPWRILVRAAFEW